MSFSSNQSGEVNQLPETIDLPEVDKGSEFKDILQREIKKVLTTVNTKIGGLYNPEEKSSFKQFFTRSNPQTQRNVYRKTFDLVDLNGGSIAAGTALNWAHGITGLTELTEMSGSALTSGGEYIPLPFSSPTLNRNIEIRLSSTNVYITTGAGIGPLDKCLVTAEYTKN